MSKQESTTTFTFALISTLFMAAAAALAAWSMYPVYGSPRYLSVAASSIAAGAIIALLCVRLGWSPLVALGLTLVAYLGIGLGLAIPGLTSGETPLPDALAALARAPITGWKDVVTLPLPLGEYGATLVPPLILLLTGTLVSSWIAAGARRWWGFAALVAASTVATAVLLGPAARAAEYTWAPYGVYINREFVVGLATFAVLLGWAGWRTSYLRHRALAGVSSGARLATEHRARVAGTIAAGAAMVAIAVATAALVTGPVSAATPREVARSVVEPRLVLNSTVTPLAAYRTYFSDSSFNQVLFTVDAPAGTVSRVRVATLPYFDGDAFTAASPTGSADLFERVPSGIAQPGDSTEVTAHISLNGLNGVWVPLVGALGSVTFHGDRSGELVDSFFYAPRTSAGLVTNDGGLQGGDSYTVVAYVPSAAPTLESIGTAPGGDVIDSSLIPASLTDWVTKQGVSRDGAGLAQLVEILRERGYLSHGLTQASVQPHWEAALGAYTFAGSSAGSSYDRIDRLFTALNERAAAVADTPGASLVAGVGDDEQFAAAVALIAADLGFPSRVVLGARLTDDDSAGWSVPTCVDGQCRGQNMAVWTEVESTTGAWIPIDVTPQHQTPPSPDVTQERDPSFASDLDPKRAEPIAPPSTQRGAAIEPAPPIAAEPGLWDTLGPFVRAAGISLLAVLVILGPLLAILVWKGLRRRRRRSGPPREAIHNGWEEYLDTAVDAGYRPLPLATRLETARAYGSLSGVRLAQLTDRTTFATEGPATEDADEFWRLIASERAAWLSDRGFWARVRMRLSLRSMWHSVATQAPTTTASTAQAAHPRGSDAE